MFIFGLFVVESIFGTVVTLISGALVLIVVFMLVVDEKTVVVVDGRVVWGDDVVCWIVVCPCSLILIESITQPCKSSPGRAMSPL